jgi:histone H3/H4
VNRIYFLFSFNGNEYNKISISSEGKVIDGDTSGLLGNNEPVEETEEPNEAQQKINLFWPQVMDEMKRIKSVEPGNQLLPLARIKKIMKLDDDVKMISAEAPLLFAKAAEVFIQELTHRAWVHTDDNKRRTLQRNDIAMAITKFDMFDFLVDIVPRDEIKPQSGPSSSHSAVPSTSTATSSSSSVIKKEPLAETSTKTLANNDQA